MTGKSFELPGHPLVLIVLAMRTFDSADEAIKGMAPMGASLGASKEAIERTTRLIKTVRYRKCTVSGLPQAAYKDWVDLAKSSTGASFGVYNRGVDQSYEILEEYLDRAARWSWGHTHKTIPVRRHMRKFRVRAEIPFPDTQYEVWGTDEDEVYDAFNDTDFDFLFPDLTVDISVVGVPDTPPHEIRDGVALESTGWTQLQFFKDEDGERIWPTDEEDKDNFKSGRERRRLENEGQQRLPLGSADPPSE